MTDNQDYKKDLLWVMELFMSGMPKDEIETEVNKYLVSNPDIMITCIRRIYSIDDIDDTDRHQNNSDDTDEETDACTDEETDDCTDVEADESGSSNNGNHTFSSPSADLSEAVQISQSQRQRCANGGIALNFTNTNSKKSETFINELNIDELVNDDDAATMCFSTAHSIGPHTSVLSDIAIPFFPVKDETATNKFI